MPTPTQPPTSTPTSTTQHRAAAAHRRARCAVLTVSDTRTLATDRGGPLITDHLEAAGHEVADYQIVQDQPEQIQATLNAWLTAPPQPQASSLTPQTSNLDAIFTTGGTGIAPRDTTIEIARRFIDKELPGFGELFRMLSYQDVGPAAMLSRAVAGLAVTPSHPAGTLIFALPGSTNAIELAMTKLILPELPHLIWERTR